MMSDYLMTTSVSLITCLLLTFVDSRCKVSTYMGIYHTCRCTVLSNQSINQFNVVACRVVSFVYMQRAGVICDFWVPGERKTGSARPTTHVFQGSGQSECPPSIKSHHFRILCEAGQAE